MRKFYQAMVKGEAITDILDDGDEAVEALVAAGYDVLKMTYNTDGTAFDGEQDIQIAIYLV